VGLGRQWLVSSGASMLMLMLMLMHAVMRGDGFFGSFCACM
jgi:hypothetical protein